MTVVILISAVAVLVSPQATAAPMVDLSMSMTPEDLQLFPTYAQVGRLEFLGFVVCNKTRPDEIRVNIEGSVDVPWDFMIEPTIVVFRSVGEIRHPFNAYLSVPPRTAGPPLVTMNFRAYADLAGRNVECTTSARLHIVQDTHDFVDAFPDKVLVPPDRGVDGTAFIENMLDRELEVHLSATGEWDALIPDLDFQQDIVLQPYEQRPARFHGRLSSDVEPGLYLVEMALWTPGEDGQRSFITTANVTLEVIEETGGTMGDTLLRTAFPLFLATCIALGLATIWFIKRRERTENMEP